MWSVPFCPQSVGVALVTRPLMIACIAHHSGLHRVQFNIALTLQKIAFGIHQAGFEAPLPERAAPVVLMIEILSVSLTERFHEHRERRIFSRCH